MAGLNNASHAIMCPDDDCCGCLYQNEQMEILCNECGKEWYLTAIVWLKYGCPHQTKTV